MSATTLFTKRLKEISDLTSGDSKFCKLLTNLKTAISRYHDAVFTMARTLQAQRFRLEGEELRDLTERLDRNRHTAHECLIDSVIIANRYLFKVYGSAGRLPEGGVYTSSPMHLTFKDRNAIGTWALDVAAAVLQ